MKTGASLQIYRKRFIPNEIVLLKSDVIILQTEDEILTKWKTLKPKATFDHGCSCYYLNKGFKVSKYYRADGSLLYYYCDIVTYEYDADADTLLVTDLLADVIIQPNGNYRVTDLDELASAAENDLLSREQLFLALRTLNELLQIIDSGKFGDLLLPFEDLQA